MTEARARTCGVYVAASMAASVLISAPADTVSAQTVTPPCPASPSNVVMQPGYSITAVACGLSMPTAMTLYNDTIWVAEDVPVVKQVDNMGNITTKLQASDLPTGTLVAPLTGIVFDAERNWFWLVHRQTNSTNAPGVPVGAISRFRPSDPKGTFQTMIAGFPSFGDHPNSQIVFADHGHAYINGAAPTNSGVVGPDDSWAPNFPTLHDFPGVDVELSGIGYQTLIGPTATWALDPNGGTPSAKITEPFMPFGGGTVPAGTVVEAPTPHKPIDGIIAGGGTVYSFNPNAANPTAMTATLRLEAWGLRNPYGIGIDPFNPNLLFVSNNGADVRQTTIGGKIVIRGSRPIDNDYDDIFVVQIGQGQSQSQGQNESKSQGPVPFFGHPDYFHDLSSRQPLPVTNPMFCPKETSPLPPNVLASPCPQFAFSDHFRANLKVQPAFAEFGPPDVHGSANMFDFSQSDTFGHKGDIFIAQTGSFPPGTGATVLTGYKVSRIDRSTGLVSDFVAHTANTDPVIFVANGFNKPIDVRFRGSEMLILDFGDFLPGVHNVPASGKIWKVTHQ
jgi:hypothetical protein